MKRSAPLLRKSPMRRKARKCSQAKDANGMTPQLRDFALREIGCIVCRLAGRSPMPAAKHHLLTTGFHGNGKRRGEAATVPVCDYHHQGEASVGSYRAALCREFGYGPSYADEPAEFRARYPDDLLLEATNKALREWQAGTMGAGA